MTTIRITAPFTLSALLLALTAAPASAQTGDALKLAAENAVTLNPDVAARFNAYRASIDSIDAIDVARAAYRPRVDVTQRRPRPLTESPRAARNRSRCSATAWR